MRRRLPLRAARGGGPRRRTLYVVDGSSSLPLQAAPSAHVAVGVSSGRRQSSRGASSIVQTEERAAARRRWSEQRPSGGRRVGSKGKMVIVNLELT